MLQVTPHMILSTVQLLNNPHIQKRIMNLEQTISISNPSKDLLNTIKLPRNLSLLTDKLPKPNYDFHSSFLRRNITQPTGDQLKLPQLNSKMSFGKQLPNEQY